MRIDCSPFARAFGLWSFNGGGATHATCDDWFFSLLIQRHDRFTNRLLFWVLPLHPPSSFLRRTLFRGWAAGSSTRLDSHMTNKSSRVIGNSTMKGTLWIQGNSVVHQSDFPRTRTPLSSLQLFTVDVVDAGDEFQVSLLSESQWAITSHRNLSPPQHC